MENETVVYVNGKDYIDNVLKVFGDIRERYSMIDSKYKELHLEMIDQVHNIELNPRIHEILMTVDSNVGKLAKYQKRLDVLTEGLESVAGKTDSKSVSKQKRLFVEFSELSATHKTLSDFIELQYIVIDLKRNRLQRRLVDNDKIEFEAVYKFSESESCQITTKNLLATREHTDTIIERNKVEKLYTPKMRKDLGVLGNCDTQTELSELGFERVSYDINCVAVIQEEDDANKKTEES